MASTKLPSEAYKPIYAACRDLGHEWDYYRWRGNHRVLICDNCTCRREDWLDGNMKVIRRRYIYPKDYQWKDTILPIKVLRQQLKREARKLLRWVGPRHGSKIILTAAKKVR